MILIDTNVVIYASNPESPHCGWARQTIANAVADQGAVINAVSLAEVCVGESNPETAADRMRNWGIQILDIPVVAAEVAAGAYRTYLERRRAQSTQTASSTPLPDFFIGAHAEVMRWELATADQGRFSTYFPSVSLKMP